MAKKRKPNSRFQLPSWFKSESCITSLLEALPRDGFKSEYLREQVLSKFCETDDASASGRRDAAIEKWLGVNYSNAKTNQRLFLNDTDLGWITSESFFRRVRALCTRVLGKVPEKRFLRNAYTNGASVEVGRSETAAMEKIRGAHFISRSAVKHWVNAASGTLLGPTRARELHGDCDFDLTEHESSEMFTVPKKSDIDRVACKEPSCNALLQRALGVHIRSRLLAYGIDLRDQSVNQRLAKEALARGLATIDLSSASDTVTTQLVINCLPFEWWSVLDDLRVKSTYIPYENGSKFEATTVDLEMFSSMGNGFTFELETLLFWAITRVVCQVSRISGTISVYGDDIIAPNKCVPRLLRVLHFCGFRPNKAKTHFRGLFRESCGKHYHRGFDVTPFYIRGPIKTLPDLINVLNRALEWDGRGWGFFLTREMLLWWERWAKAVPSEVYGGHNIDDPYRLVTGDAPRLRLQPKTVQVNFDQKAGFVHWLMSASELGTESQLSPTEVREGKFVLCLPTDVGEQALWSPFLLDAHRYACWQEQRREEKFSLSISCEGGPNDVGSRRKTTDLRKVEWCKGSGSTFVRGSFWG